MIGCLDFGLFWLFDIFGDFGDFGTLGLWDFGILLFWILFL